MKLRQYLLVKPIEFDFELYSDEEEHDAATVVENPLFTWDLDFQEEWKDVIESEIVKYIPASDRNAETLIINGAKASRIEMFQFILAGYCPTDYWDKHHLEIE